MHILVRVAERIRAGLCGSATVDNCAICVTVATGFLCAVQRSASQSLASS